MGTGWEMLAEHGGEALLQPPLHLCHKRRLVSSLAVSPPGTGLKEPFAITRGAQTAVQAGWPGAAPHRHSPSGRALAASPPNAPRTRRRPTARPRVLCEDSPRSGCRSPSGCARASEASPCDRPRTCWLYPLCADWSPTACHWRGRPLRCQSVAPLGPSGESWPRRARVGCAGCLSAQ